MSTAIEWTDETCNVVAGCTAVDAGCTHCYAADTAAMRVQHFEGLAKRTAGGAKWTGKLRYRPDMAEALLRTRKPKRVFWCSMGDLFHPDVPDEWLDHAFAVMALTPHLLHQVLTRRVERMADYLHLVEQRVGRYAFPLAEEAKVDWDWHWRKYHAAHGRPRWPLPNVVAMTSVIDQETADERLPHLLRCPARWRSVSYEPALGAVDFSPWLPTYDHTVEVNGVKFDARNLGGLISAVSGGPTRHATGLVGKQLVVDQIIAGGESGPRARPPHPQWFRDTRDACEAAGVAFFFKQWGAWGPLDQQMPIDDVAADDSGRLVNCGGERMVKVGKKRAGRLLDGREHNAEPWEWRDGAWRARP